MPAHVDIGPTQDTSPGFHWSGAGSMVLPEKRPLGVDKDQDPSSKRQNSGGDGALCWVGDSTLECNLQRHQVCGIRTALRLMKDVWTGVRGG